MSSDNISNTVLHMSRSVMSEQARATIEKRALQDLIETLNANGIKCHAAVSKRDNVLRTQYYARIGSSIVPIGTPSVKTLTTVTEFREYNLEYYTKGASDQYSYTIMALCDADAVEAAKAYCSMRSTSIGQATLVDSEDNFIWEF